MKWSKLNNKTNKFKPYLRLCLGNGIRNGRTQNLSNGKSLTKIIKVRTVLTATTSRSRRCYLLLALCSSYLRHHHQSTSETPRSPESAKSSNHPSQKSSKENEYQELFHIILNQSQHEDSYFLET